MVSIIHNTTCSQNNQLELDDLNMSRLKIMNFLELE